MMTMLRALCRGLLLAAITTTAADAQTPADFPIGPVRILVPFPAGGPADVIMRIPSPTG